MLDYLLQIKTELNKKETDLPQRMENKYKNSGDNATDSEHMDSWDSIKAEFNNILQNEFSINPEDPKSYTATPDSPANLSATLMQNGIGFSTMQDAILKNINSHTDETTEQDQEEANKEKNWNGLASSLINDHEQLLQTLDEIDKEEADAEVATDANTLIKPTLGESLSKPAYPHPAGNSDQFVNQFTPYSINADQFLPFNPSSISNIEESIKNLRNSSKESNEHSSVGWQGEIYNGLNLMNSYYQCYYKLQGTLALAIPKATVEFKERIANEIPEAEEKFSVTDIYYLWLDSCEQAYTQVTATEEFSKHLGDLVNTYSELKIAASGFSENVSTFTGLPTQKDLDASYREQYILRKQQHTIKEDLQSIQHQREMDNKVNNAKIDTLTSEIEILKQQISQLKGLLDDSHNSAEPKQPADKNNDNMH